jgi:hypothetical protein
MGSGFCLVLSHCHECRYPSKTLRVGISLPPCDREHREQDPSCRVPSDQQASERPQCNAIRPASGCRNRCRHKQQRAPDDERDVVGGHDDCVRSFNVSTQREVSSIVRIIPTVTNGAHNVRPSASITAAMMVASKQTKMALSSRTSRPRTWMLITQRLTCGRRLDMWVVI